MKIKVKPEDFIVEEIIDAPILKEGRFRLYRLQKSGLNTLDVLVCVSRSLGIPISGIAYGGRKDRHALTAQYITIEGQARAVKIAEKNFSLQPVGFLKTPMSPRLIAKNIFKVTVRSLSSQECSRSLEALPRLIRFGLANYFDDQRLGSFDRRSGFLAEKIIKGHFNGALKIYLTRITSEDKRADIERKNLFFDNWSNWQECAKKAKTEFEHLAFSRLAEEPKVFVRLLQQIPAQELFLHFSAYQAYLWNEVLRRLISLKVKSAQVIYKGKCGDYLFYQGLSSPELTYWRRLLVPLVSSKMSFRDEALKSLYQVVLQENGLRPALFNLRKIRQAYFKSLARPAIVFAQDLTFEIMPDELYMGRKRLVLNFALPRGCFGTMLIKRLFAQRLSYC
jgi:tRNA pseudouridine13 synthase